MSYFFRLLPTHRDAMAVAPVGVIVPQRMVLRAAVVPKCNRVRRPLEAHAQLGGLNVPIKHFENRVAFALAQTGNMRGEEAIQRIGISYLSRDASEQFRCS